MKLLGVHLPTLGNILSLFNSANELEIDTAAFFTASTLSYSIDKKIKADLSEHFRQKLSATELKLFSHATYLINIADPQKIENYRKSILAIESELIRCSSLNLIGAVIHPGSNKNKIEGITTIQNSINEIIERYNGSSLLLIESSAGQGCSLPSTIEDIANIMSGLSHKSKEKIGLVIDTCHVHAAGYNLSSKKKVNIFLDEYDKKIGLDKVKLLHLNDSKGKAGNFRDRHENIGKGSIGLEGFCSIITDNRLSHIAKILETPVKNYLDWKNDLAVLRELEKSPKVK